MVYTTMNKLYILFVFTYSLFAIICHKDKKNFAIIIIYDKKKTAEAVLTKINEYKRTLVYHLL